MKRLIFLFLFFTVKQLDAQTPYKFFQIFLDKGLTDARVNAIVQDQYGFMWFASGNGLNRYDGYSIRTFFADAKNNGLTSNNTTALFSDSKGTLWVGTSSGLVRFNFSKEKFERFAATEPINTAFVNCITEDASGNIYAGTNEGLLWWKRSTGEWKNMSASLNQEKRLIYIRGLLFFDKNTLYATTENRGFYKIDITKTAYETIRYKTIYQDTCCLFTIGMQKMNDSMMLIGTLSLGLTKFNTRTNQFSLTEGPLKKNDSILFNTTYQVMKDHSGRFWTANYYFRLAEYFPASNLSVPVPREPYNPYGFDGNAATCVFEDRQHNIWIGTPRQGVYRFNPNESRVKFYSVNPVEPGGLQKGHVMSLAKMDDDLLMVGMDAGASFYSKRSNRFLNLKGIAKELGTLPLEQVQCGLMDREGIMWMGTNRIGIMRYNPATKTMRTFGRLTKPNPLRDDGISNMVEMEGDSMMLVGFNRINTFNRKTFKSHSFRNDSMDLPLYNLTGVADVAWNIARKKIWIAGSNGYLHGYDPVTGVLADKTAMLNSLEKPLVINNINIDGQDRLWLASNRGAICIEEGQMAKIYRLNKSVNTSEEIKNILPVGQDVWLTNNRTLARLNTTNGQITYLGEKDGFSNVQLFGNSLTLSAWQTVLIGSNKGFYEIFPVLINDDKLAAPAWLTSFKVYDKPFETAEAVSTVKKIDLGYDQNFFSFDISAFDYSEGDDIEYAYKLKGFDQDWQYIGKNRSGSYTNVSGGNYTLLLKSRNGNGQWNEHGQAVKIHVGKPFWQRSWFLFLVLAATAGILYAVYKNRIRSIRKESKLHSDYAIKLNELENSALRTQMSPHFIFNSLNTINSFINRNDPAKANQYISKFSKLIRLILDHSREKKITLAEELDVLELYVQLERIRFSDKFNYHIDIDHSIVTDTTEIPPLIIQPFVENAILHGLLPLPEGGDLKVGIEKELNHILFIIEDNGIGRQQAKHNKPDTILHRKSHGIDITMKRIELFNKDHNFSSAVKIIDLKNPEGTAAGTRVEIRMALVESF
ncbi:MAG: histidine kinase [Rhizobacter sp.]|nr:histidine kinase [Ferruginibacter sp.]